VQQGLVDGVLHLLLTRLHRGGVGSGRQALIKRQAAALYASGCKSKAPAPAARARCDGEACISRLAAPRGPTHVQQPHHQRVPTCLRCVRSFLSSLLVSLRGWGGGGGGLRWGLYGHRVLHQVTDLQWGVVGCGCVGVWCVGVGVVVWWGVGV
jgi:hypothetical protein